jgi:metal-responsive CopG/Arc/MetJ family transcriptional regulator
MPKTITREPFVRQSISFPRSLLVEIRRIVIEDEQHGNLSRFMQDVMRAEVARRKDAQKEQAA